MKVLFLRPEGSEVPRINGVEVINLPLFKIRCIEYYLPESFDGIGFASVNAVKCFKDFDKIKGKKIYAVGSSTAKLLSDLGFNPIVPEEYTVNNMVDKMIKDGIKNILVVRSKEGISDLLGVTQIADYELELIKHNLDTVIKILENCEIDYVIVTSSSIGSLIKDHLKPCVKVISIGPITSKGLKGVNNLYEAKQHDMEGILKLLSSLMRDYNG
jgi:uroporphyrinogen-III synthase